MILALFVMMLPWMATLLPAQVFIPVWVFWIGGLLGLYAMKEYQWARRSG